MCASGARIPAAVDSCAIRTVVCRTMRSIKIPACMRRSLAAPRAPRQWSRRHPLFGLLQHERDLAIALLLGHAQGLDAVEHTLELLGGLRRLHQRARRHDLAAAVDVRGDGEAL